MEKENLDNLKKVRDKLSFVIFTLTVKTKHNLEFSNDEAAGLRDVLSQISHDLLKISKSYEQIDTPEARVQKHISSIERELPWKSTE